MAPSNLQISRRAFLQGSSLLLLSAGARNVFSAEESPRLVRASVITDLHHADKPPSGTRYYRQTLTKLKEAAQHFADDKPDFIVELGDYIDAADAVETELKYVQQVNEVFGTIPGPKHYVLGNHCVDMLTKDEFLTGVGKKESYYSFDAGGVHFIVLDACFNSAGKPYGRKSSQWNDANLPADQLEWLRADLKKTDNKVIILAHQRLDEIKDYAVKNAAATRKILEASGKVLAVFQGHSHKNDHQELAGIHYCTLVAMVEGSGAENNGYSLVDVHQDGTIRATGFRKQATYNWAKLA